MHKRRQAAGIEEGGKGGETGEGAGTHARQPTSSRGDAHAMKTPLNVHQKFWLTPNRIIMTWWLGMRNASIRLAAMHIMYRLYEHR
jgi:hypothetical protein